MRGRLHILSRGEFQKPKIVRPAGKLALGVSEIPPERYPPTEAEHLKMAKKSRVKSLVQIRTASYRFVQIRTVFVQTSGFFFDFFRPIWGIPPDVKNFRESGWGEAESIDEAVNLARGCINPTLTIPPVNLIYTL